MNKLYLALESMSKVNELRIKAKRQREQEVKNAAWKTHCKGYLSAFDYVKICNKNNQLSF